MKIFFPVLIGTALGLMAEGFAASTNPSDTVEQAADSARFAQEYGDVWQYFSAGGSDSILPPSLSLMVSFPPPPPVLGESGFSRQVHTASGLRSPLVLLSRDQFEPYFPALAALMLGERVSKGRQARLDRYRSDRDALLAELRDHLLQVDALDVAARARAHVAFAREQASRLEDCEAKAEELRADFSRVRFLDAGETWVEIGSPLRSNTDDARFRTRDRAIHEILGAAAFRVGFSPGQRRLLCELGLEMTEEPVGAAGQRSRTEPARFASGDVWFFPATARIRIPANIPPQLAAMIGDYVAQKDVVKKELQDTLEAQSHAFFEYQRVRAFEALAENQAGRIEALEKLAEDIRVGLAVVDDPAHPPSIGLPDSLATRVDQFNRLKIGLQRAILAKFDEVRRAIPDGVVQLTREKEAYVIAVSALNHRSERRGAAVLSSLVLFNEKQRTDYLALAREKAALSGAIERYARSVEHDAEGRTPEQLIRDFSGGIKVEENWELYRDYRIAALEPGLSPGQRRLLFGDALKALDLPLVR